MRKTAKPGVFMKEEFGLAIQEAHRFIMKTFFEENNRRSQNNLRPWCMTTLLEAMLNFISHGIAKGFFKREAIDEALTNLTKHFENHDKKSLSN